MPRKPWQRTGEDRRIRGRAGQRARARRLARTEELCEQCLDEGRSQLATQVDHITPLARGGEDIDSNTRNLCEAHHIAVTAEQFGRAAPTEGRGIDRQGRPTASDHPWNRRG